MKYKSRFQIIYSSSFTLYILTVLHCFTRCQCGKLCVCVCIRNAAYLLECIVGLLLLVIFFPVLQKHSKLSCCDQILSIYRALLTVSLYEVQPSMKGVFKSSYISKKYPNCIWMCVCNLWPVINVNLQYCQAVGRSYFEYTHFLANYCDLQVKRYDSMTQDHLLWLSKQE